MVNEILSVTETNSLTSVTPKNNNHRHKAKRRKKKAKHTSSQLFHNPTHPHSNHKDKPWISDSKNVNDPSFSTHPSSEEEEENHVQVEYISEDLAPELQLFFKSVVERFNVSSYPSSLDLDFDLPSPSSPTFDLNHNYNNEDKEDIDFNSTKELKEQSGFVNKGKGNYHQEHLNKELEKDKEQENEVEEEGEAEEEDEEDEITMSKRKLRKARRLTVAELKQLVEKPEVVEWVDVCAADPKLLVDIKSTRNVVPIPVHWSQKRKYLQNKRGIEKPPFELPDFIRATGIQTLRELSDQPDATLKQKTRERVQPKMGKLVIDYAKLHDAFFKWQTKPEMTQFGEMYYEGREYETKLKTVRPGAPLSEELKEALNMPLLAPPPWLINMQRFGPPPSYPGLKIPGLNAPIPNGAQWGFHPGGWGKPPVDEYGRSLYGDVFGSVYDPQYMDPYALPIESELWGELPAEMDELDEEEDEMDEHMDLDGDEDLDSDQEGSDQEAIPMHIETIQGMDEEDLSYHHGSRGVLEIAELKVINQGHFTSHRLTSSGDLETPTQSIDQENEEEGEDMEIEEFVAGLETPAIPTDIELRKTQITKSTMSHPPRSTTSSSSAHFVEVSKPFQPPSLYTILPEKKISVTGMMGSERIYDLGAIATSKPFSSSSTSSSSEVSSSSMSSETPLPTSATTPSATPSRNKDEKKKKPEEKKKKEFKF